MAPIATSTTTLTESAAPATAPAKLKLNVPTAESPEWLHQLRTQGFAVVKGVIPRERAEAYADRMYQWVEDFGLGFDRNDPSTRTKDKIHFFYKGESNGQRSNAVGQRWRMLREDVPKTWHTWAWTWTGVGQSETRSAAPLGLQLVMGCFQHTRVLWSTRTDSASQAVCAMSSAQTYLSPRQKSTVPRSVPGRRSPPMSIPMTR